MILTQVDAFTNAAFSGNPAAVCLLPAPRSDCWMQRVAAEMNLAETAFLQRRADGGFDLRWFTPVLEVDLCGHATLASAHALWEQGACAPEAPIAFHTRSGVLRARRRDAWIELDFPAVPAQPATPPPGFVAALGAQPHYLGRNRFDYLAELASEAAVRSLRPDLRALGAVDARGVIITAAAADPGFDFVSRFFAPAAGIDEDPVTGSAHCCLGPYWQRRLGKANFMARQLSARGGVLGVEVSGKRVRLRGQAVTVFTAVLCAPAAADIP